MSEPKSKRGLRARAARALDKVFGRPVLTGGRPPKLSSSALTPSKSRSAAQLDRPSDAANATEGYLSEPVSPASILSISISLPDVPAPDVSSSTAPLAASKNLPIGGKNAALDVFHKTLRGLHKSSVVFPPLQKSIGNLISCLETFELPGRNKLEYEALVLELTTLSESLAQYWKTSKSVPMSGFIVKTAQSIQQQVELIESKKKRGEGRRLEEAMQDNDDIITCYRRIQGLFRQLQIDADLSIWSIANEQLANTRLNDLKPVKLAAYNSSLSTEINRRMCTENTRTSVLSDLNTWSEDSNAPNVYWMNGMAGTGKTTIACTFTDRLKGRKQLAASFFCTRTTAECQDVARIVPTIAYQLARYSTPFQSALCQVLGSDPDVSSCTVSTQFERLLKEPLLEVKDAIPEGLVVVIDALDECTAPKGVELVLDMLFRAAADLPLKFFIASRPEPGIRNKIQNRPETLRSVFILHDIEKSLVQADIELYLREELSFLTSIQVKRLAKLAGRLFIYAATAVRYILIGESYGDLEERLQTMLSISTSSENKHAEIDQLYASILSAALNKQSLEKKEKERIRLVLWTVVCAREPLKIETLARLTGMDARRTLAMLQPLRSVVYVSDNNNLVTTLHASLPDFILDEARSSEFFCNTKHHSQLLARECLTIMKEQLRFNICEMESSYGLDQSLANLNDRVDRVVSPTLAYACRYWGDHLRQAAASDELCALIQDFLQTNLLFWMEVMNLKRWMGIGARVILAAKRWLMDCCVSSELPRFAADAENFVIAFAASAVSQSTPHLYVSALPFCHKSSAVFKHYSRQTQGLIRPKGTITQGRGAALLASWNIGSRVNSVAYSQDGAYLAVGCDDGSIVMKDAYDGTVIGAPLEGHAGPVRSVAFSFDGSRIVSGSNDYTNRVWNVHDGTLDGNPFEGHTDHVTSVAFSPDGSLIVSGSNDKTIRLWDVQDGTPVGTPFKGHTAYITSVAFSPDGSLVISGSEDRTIRVWSIRDSSFVGAPFNTLDAFVTSVAFSPNGLRIGSGSNDYTIRVWDVRNRKLIGTPLTGHTDYVTSIAFSSDSSRIVSGSEDRTIRVWSLQDGTMICTPFEGHAGYVTSVAFSPDDSRVVSGSSDKSIRVWNVQPNAYVKTPFKGHTRSVTSVAFSSDGSRIVSGSQDRTVRLWNVRDSTLVDTHFKGHTDYVTSVGFSPDGSRIVSGSEDCTIRMWSVQGGALLGTPFKGHVDYVRSVSFSPDGSRIVSGSNDKSIRVWSAQVDPLVNYLFQGYTDGITSVAFSSDGARIVSGGSDSTIRVWNIQDDTPVGTSFEGHTGSVTSVAFSPDGSHIVSGSYDRTIRVWNIQDGALFGTPFEGHTGSVTSVAFSPDGSRIVSGSSDKTIRMWDAQDGTLVGTLRVSVIDEDRIPSVTSVAISPDGSHIISGYTDTTIRMWNVQNGTLVSNSFEGHTRVVTSVAFSPDGTLIASGSADSTIRMWSPQDGALVCPALRGHKDRINSVAFSHDSSRVVSSSDDKTIRIWDSRSGVSIGMPLEGHTSFVTSAVFSPDNSRVVSGSSDKTIRIWSARVDTLVGTPFEGHTYSVTSVCFSPDGSHIASGSNDQTVRVWNVQDCTPVGTPFEGHTDYVTSVAFSPDGSLLVSGSEDRTICVWSVHNCTLVGIPFKGHTGYITSVAFSPDGSRIVSGSADKTIRMWSVQDGTVIGPPLKVHTSGVRSVGFSPDGLDIVSGSEDKTIRISNSHVDMVPIGEISQYYLYLSPFDACTTATDTCTFSKDGWLLSDSRLLFWVPPDLAQHLSLPSNLWAANPKGIIYIDCKDILLGHEWSRCYLPRRTGSTPDSAFWFQSEPLEGTLGDRRA